MIKNTTKRQKLGWVIFIVYLIFLAYFLFFSEDFGRGSHLQEEYAYNLVPFKEIRRFIVYWHVVGIRSFLLNIVGNVVGFMPFGFFLPVISRRSRHWYNTVLLSFLFSLCIETVQLIWKGQLRRGRYDSQHPWRITRLCVLQNCTDDTSEEEAACSSRKKYPILGNHLQGEALWPSGLLPPH